MNTVLLLQKIHGHLALLTIALLLHPAFTLRGARLRSGPTRLSCYLGSLGALLTNALGWFIYPAYRVELKASIYALGKGLGDLFEVKEHLAWYSLLLALAGAAVTLQAKAGSVRVLTPTVRLIYLIAACLMIVAAVIGVYLTTLRGFPHAP